MRFGIRYIFILTGLMIAWGFVGCAKKEDQATRAIREGILLLDNGSEPQSLDPQQITGNPESNIIAALLEGLIAYHPTDDNLPEPGVAERWQHNEDYSTWTFYLREDAKWSNGDPVLASDFVFSYNRMLSPGLGAQYSDMLYIMENAEAFNKGEIQDFSKVGVKALAERVLEIHLRGPTPYFLSMLKHTAWFPVHPGTILKFGEMTSRDTKWTLPGNYVGNGPFILSEWVVNERIRVTRNPEYWDRDSVKLNEIHFLPVEESNTEETMFLAGQTHLAYEVPVDKVPYYRESRPDITHLDPFLATYYYLFNTTRPPLDDMRVRMALNLAIDRKAIVDKVTRGGQRPAAGFTPDGMGGYQTPHRLKLDLKRARELLSDAGYPGGKNFPKLDILINTSENHTRIAEAIQEMWRNNLGINVQILNQEWKVFLDTLTNRNYDIARLGWVGDYMDPLTFLGIYTTGNGNNRTGWSSPAYDDLIEQAQMAATPKKHYALLQQAEEIFLTEVPIMPIYWYTRVYLLDPRVKNWNPKLLDNHPYKYIYFEE